MSSLTRIVFALVVTVPLAFGTSAKVAGSANGARPAAASQAMPALDAAGQRLLHPSGPSTAPLTQVAPAVDPPCDPSHVSDRWTDPSTGERLVCRCDFFFKRNGEPAWDCAWLLEDEYPDPSTWVNLNSGLYMDVDKVSKSDGARIHQWTYTGGGNQWWGMRTDACGCIGFVNSTSVNSGKCLGVAGGSTAQGASIVQWGCNNHPDQVWHWIYTGLHTSSGWPVWNIVNANSGLCLGIGGGSTTLGAYAVQWECNGHADQFWF